MTEQGTPEVSDEHAAPAHHSELVASVDSGEPLEVSQLYAGVKRLLNEGRYRPRTRSPCRSPFGARSCQSVHGANASTRTSGWRGAPGRSRTSPGSSARDGSAPASAALCGYRRNASSSSPRTGSTNSRTSRRDRPVCADLCRAPLVFGERAEDFLARGGGTVLSVTPDEAALALTSFGAGAHWGAVLYREPGGAEAA